MTGRIVAGVMVCWVLCGLRGLSAEVDFGREVKPLLETHCLKCHGPEKQKGGLRLDNRAGALGKGDSGESAILPGRPDRSMVLRRVTATDATQRMPPGDNKLTEAQIQLLRRWIAAGAGWPEEAKPAETAKKELVVTEEDRRHWAYLPLKRVNPPRVMRADWVRTPIDRFILAALEARGIAPTPSASPTTLARRASFDLTGLPLSPEQTADFIKEAAVSPGTAWEGLVDRLLASRGYGERWGRHWLDVARYADSNGQEGDQDRPSAYRYRDFVIRALNEDLPYDTFVRWQLAGDEYLPDNPEAVAATGFLTAGPNTVLADTFLEEERLRNRYNELDDMLATMGSAFLGMTLGCARCHDHKLDPVPSRDYYRLLSAFHSGDRAEVPLGPRAEITAHKKRHAEWEHKLRLAESRLKTWLDGEKNTLVPGLRRSKIVRLPISDKEKALLRGKPESAEARKLAKKHEKALTVTDKELRSGMSPASRKRWDDLAGEIAAIKKSEPAALPEALAFRDLGAKPATTWLFQRADFYDRDEPVQLGFLTVLTRDRSAADYHREAKAAGDRADTTYQRRALAEWITDVDQGGGMLLARVIVNRVWQHHFGEGLVRTVNDFGAQGDQPSHPDLLEWLAADLIAHGWKLKRLHRMIMTSATYQQGITFDRKKAEVDPENRLWWRMRPRRLEAEALRDAILAVSGTLNPQAYGPAFRAPIVDEAMVARNLKSPYPRNIPDGPAVHRRSVYMFHKRVIPYPLFQAFDAPDALQCTGKRNITTVAPQALALLNDAFVRDRAADFASRLLKDGGDSPVKWVERAYPLAFGRSATPLEHEAGARLITRQIQRRTARDKQASPQQARRQALTDFTQVLFGLNEFIYID